MEESFILWIVKVIKTHLHDFKKKESLGSCPTALEWDMKLWWVHLEAMVASLMTFRRSGEKQDWDTFLKVFK